MSLSARFTFPRRMPGATFAFSSSPKLPRDISSCGHSMRELEIAIQTVKSFQDTLDIFQHKFAGGAASGLEVSRAQAALSNVAAVIPDLRRQIVAQEVALNLLLGRSPGPINRGSHFDRAV